MSARNVTDGAKCECTLGSASSVLGFPGCETIRLRESAGLNIYDQNFLGPFGDCQRDKIKCLPCTPKPVGPWSNDAPRVFFGGPPTLVETAKMRCAYGGEITIVDPGIKDIYSGDEVFVGADGKAHIVSGSREEREKTKYREGVKKFNQRLDNYLENPALDLAGALADTLSKSKENNEILRSNFGPRGRTPRR